MEIPREWTYYSSGTKMGTATGDIHIFFPWKSHGNGHDAVQELIHGIFPFSPWKFLSFINDWHILNFFPFFHGNSMGMDIL